MNRFFVYHPVFAWVIALFIALFGVIALRSLPIEQYPAVAPPSLNVDITYNGADAETLDRNATSIISKVTGFSGVGLIAWQSIWNTESVPQSPRPCKPNIAEGRTFMFLI